MKRISFILLTLPFILIIQGQNVGIGTKKPNASAILELSDTTKGFLPPRLTYIQRVNISNPTAGLVLWCTDCGGLGELQVFNGISWTNMVGAPASTYPYIGQAYQGGIVAYLLQPGDPGYDIKVTHGLISAISDQSSPYIQWYNGSYTLTGATSTTLGAGNANTNAIVASQGPGSYAAKLCYDYIWALLSDWYLPSKDELSKLFISRMVIGGFVSNNYWSSSEVSQGSVYVQNFSSGLSDYLTKSGLAYVRAIRSF